MTQNSGVFHNGWFHVIFLQPVKSFLINMLIDSLFYSQKLLLDKDITIKETNVYGFSIGFALAQFCFWECCELDMYHYLLWQFVSVSYSQIHCSSLVLTIFGKSGSFSMYYRNLQQTSTLLFFCSRVRFLGTNYTQTFLVCFTQICLFVKIW